MGRTVAELRATLHTDELASWIAFAERSPLLEDRLDLLFARLCLLVCEVGGAKKRSGAPFTLQEFLLFRAPEAPKAGNVLEFFRARVNPLRIKKTGQAAAPGQPKT